MHTSEHHHVNAQSDSAAPKAQPEPAALTKRQQRLTNRVRSNIDAQLWAGEVARVPNVEAPPLPAAGQRAHLQAARKNFSNQLKGRGRNRAQRRQLARLVNLSFPEGVI